MSRPNEASRFTDLAHIGAWATKIFTIPNTADGIFLEGYMEGNSKLMECWCKDKFMLTVCRWSHSFTYSEQCEWRTSRGVHWVLARYYGWNGPGYLEYETDLWRIYPRVAVWFNVMDTPETCGLFGLYSNATSS
jgi:hypothetical protein